MLEQIYEMIRPYDSDDLLTTIAALQICPENADYLFRLEALAHTVVSVPFTDGKPRISRHRIDRLCNEPPLGGSEIQSQEDPCPNAFTEAFTFFRGSYIVFPGQLGEPSFILKHLNEAIFFSKNFKQHREFQKKIYELNQGILAISDAIAQRAVLRRNLPPLTVSRRILIPHNLDDLKSAVRFTTDEVDDLLDVYNLPHKAIQPFTIEFGELNLGSYTFQNSPLHAKPIVRVGRNIIVSEPGMLLASLRHQILLIAKGFGLLDMLSSEYHLAVVRTVRKSLDLFQYKQIQVELPIVDEGHLLHDSIWSLDTDKVLYVAVNTDDFADYVGEQVFEDHDGQLTANLIDNRLALVEEVLFTQASSLNEVFLMVVNSGVGRTNVYGFNLPGLKTDPAILILSASELEVLSLKFGYDQLVLYKFAKASNKLRETAKVLAWSVLDEFEIYQSNDYSFYFSDERRPNAITFQPGNERILRLEVLEKLDIHAVPYLSPGSYIEVVNIYQAPEVPIYSSLDLFEKRMDYFVEIVPLPTWITVNPKLLEDDVVDDYHPNPRVFADMISYWLWQFDPDFSILLAGVTPEWPMIIELDLALAENWQSLIEDDESVTPIICDLYPESFTLRLVFNPPIVKLIERLDNTGEMYCMRVILENVSDLLRMRGWELEAKQLRDNIQIIIDKHSSNPKKKKVLSLNPSNNPVLLPGVPVSFRKVQEADRSILLDELGEYLSNELKLQVGPISEDRVTWVLNKAVDYYYLELQELISSLSSTHLLDFLVTYHEAIVRERATLKLTIPTQLACFSTENELAEQLKKQIPEVNEAAISCRFLIEYVTARPPKGIRPISLSVYDRLMALSSEIIGRGNQSDLDYYGIFNVELAMLNSGRLGFNRQEYLVVFNSFLGVRTIEEIDQAGRFFHHWWKIKSPVNQEELPEQRKEMDLAFQAEFGVTLIDISIFISELGNLSTDLGDEELKKVRLDKLVSKMRDVTGWENSKIINLIDFLSLKPRVDFLVPPPPFRKTDVYPWRMSRGASYIRRPLLRVYETGDDVVCFGVRHLFASFDYILQMIVSGRLQSEYHSKEMQNLLGKIHRQDGEDFNRRVASIVSRIEDSMVRSKVRKFGKLRIGAPGNDLGDLDVFVLIPCRKRIYIIECKNLEIGRTPVEMARELESIFNGTDETEAAVKKQLHRQKWVENNLETILMDYGIQKRGIWHVESLLVVNQELITPHFQKSPIPVYSILRFENELGGL